MGNVKEEENCDIATAPDTERELRLTAVNHILYASKQYKPGDTLPSYDRDMVSAWLKNHTAVWRSAQEREPLKAVPVTAESGLPGYAVPGHEEDLAGKIPDSSRGRRKQ